MKTFVLGTSIGGFVLEYAAYFYLLWRKFKNTVDYSKLSFSEESELGKAYHNFDNFQNYFESNRDMDLFRSEPSYDEMKSNRNVLIPYLELLEYDYKEFDEYNNGYELRLTTVPDDAPVHIESEPEYFTEYLAEHTRYYKKPNDLEDWLRYKIGMFFEQKDIWKNEKEVNPGIYGYDGITFSIDGDYGIAKYMDKYVILSKTEFYNRPATFEIVEFKGEDKSVFTQRITQFVIGKDKLEKYAKLIMDIKEK